MGDKIPALKLGTSGVRLSVTIAALLFSFSKPAQADSTWLYAVQISALVQSNPPAVMLSWPPDPYGSDRYEVSRKLVNDAQWELRQTLPGSATSFTDTGVLPGVVYEYWVKKTATLGYTGHGYACAGIAAPLIEERGRIILVVAADTSALSHELARLESDLLGDGWTVVRHDVGGIQDPVVIKELIRQDYWAAPAQTKALFLFGHVPVFTSGTLNYDSHGPRPFPADAFYGDMDGDWKPHLPPEQRPSYMPSDIELMVGRVDFSNLPSVIASSAWPSETELLRHYLNKDHAWRHKLLTVPRRALVANRAGDAGGLAYAASGYRNFQPFVGPAGIYEANVEDNSPAAERWISKITAGAWLWTYACGGGTDSSISHLGKHGAYNDVWTTDIVQQDAKAVFSMLFGSHFGEWNRTDNVMRAMLATSTGLAVCLAGLPHWYVHHMSMGQPIGYGTRLTMNNRDLYRNQSNGLQRAVLINLLGDPTLRLDQVTPPAGLTVAVGNPGATLNWTHSPDANAGYQVYRSSSVNGPFMRLTPTPVKGNSYLDSSVTGPGLRTYMLRAVALQNHFSGSYFNPSQGICATAQFPSQPVPPIMAIRKTPSGVQIEWSSSPGAWYYVEVRSGAQGTWANISGALQATSTQLSFVDKDWSSSEHWYRIARLPD